MQGRTWLARGLGAVTIVAFAALSIVPLFPDALVATPADDLATHALFGREMLRALAGFEVPPRTAPTANFATHYPLFQLYGLFPYFIAGACGLLGANPYTGIKAMLLVTGAAGGLAVAATVQRLGGSRVAGTAAAAAFLLAPYRLADIYGRAALVEVAAFSVIAIVFWLALRLADPEAGIGRAVALGAGLALLAATHNIFALYTPVFFAAFWLALEVATRSPLRARLERLGRLVLAGAIGLLLSAFLWAPALELAPLLHITHASAPDPFAAARYAPLDVLLSPTFKVAADAAPTCPGLAAQVGLVFLIAAVACVLPLFRGPGERTPAPARASFFILFAAALLVAASPVDLWRYLPAAFKSIQFPYRALVYVTVAGSVLTGLLVTDLLRARRPLLLLVLLGLGTAAAPQYLDLDRYGARRLALTGEDLRRSAVHTHDYIVAPAKVPAAAKVPATATSPPLCHEDRWLRPEPLLLVAPGERPADLALRLNPIVPLEASIEVDGDVVAAREIREPTWFHIPLAGGAGRTHALRIRADRTLVPGPHDTRALSLMLLAVALLERGGAAPETGPKVEVIRVSNPARDRPVFTVTTDRAGFVSLPLQWYPPTLLKVLVNGREATALYGPDGRASVRVQAGTHIVQARFRSAYDLLSFEAAVGCLLFVIGSSVRALGRRRAPAS
jgi:hypothetical protein